MSPADVRRALWQVYTRSLKRYVSPAGILARSLQKTDDGWLLTEPDVANTATVLKAAFVLERAGLAHGLDARGLLDRLVADHLPAADHQGTTLMLWAAALGESPHAAGIWQALLPRIPDTVSQSMPLAWTLSAVCAYAATASAPVDIAGVARRIADRLLDNQDRKTALFYPSAAREGVLRRRRADTTLSSQTYPIYALTQYARIFSASAALEAARACADRVTALQGPQGQWWWRYDARRGTVHQPYPVYAVNQDGAVPLALGAVQSALGDRRYDAAIDRGLAWEGGSNESRQSLLDVRGGFVARSIEPDAGSYRISWEMYSYQPARALLAMASDPAWLAQALA